MLALMGGGDEVEEGVPRRADHGAICEDEQKAINT